MMQYSLNHIHTAADCDLLIANAEEAQKDSAYQQIVLEKKLEDCSVSAVEIEAGIQIATSELTFLKTVIDRVEGKAKKKLIKRQAELVYKLNVLEEKRESSGIIAVMVKQFELKQLEGQMAITTAFLTDLRARKNELLPVSVIKMAA